MTDPAAIRKILPMLAAQAGIDWGLPLAAWNRDVMIGFLMLASRLIDEVDEQDLTSRKFVLKLQAVAGVDEIKALRWALKRLLRGYGLRCIDIREE
jgi:hypothetical protein